MRLRGLLVPEAASGPPVLTARFCLQVPGEVSNCAALHFLLVLDKHSFLSTIRWLSSIRGPH